MAKTVADFMLERLSDWGVERVYGYLGDGSNGLLAAFHDAVPPLPPHITLPKELSQALIRGDDAAVDIAKRSLRGKLAEITNR